jgi:predicted cupin superfamily sugar epimerase
MHSTTAKTLIEQLALARHPEGGWFKETYRASDKLAAQALPARFDGDRSASTAIYFLLEAGDISALHRIQSDEVWHFYAGSTLRVHGIFPDGTYQGGNSAPIWLRASSSRPWCLRAAGLAQELAEGDFALVGCTVAPGFDFADFGIGASEAATCLLPTTR